MRTTGRLYDWQTIRQQTACPCDPKTGISEAVIDAIEERKLSGGFDTSRKNQCPDCFQVRSKNGTCGCL